MWKSTQPSASISVRIALHLGVVWEASPFDDGLHDHVGIVPMPAGTLDCPGLFLALVFCIWMFIGPADRVPGPGAGPGGRGSGAGFGPGFGPEGRGWGAERRGRPASPARHRREGTAARGPPRGERRSGSGSSTRQADGWWRRRRTAADGGGGGIHSHARVMTAKRRYSSSNFFRENNTFAPNVHYCQHVFLYFLCLYMFFFAYVI
jgi:hypothetical protein